MGMDRDIPMEGDYQTLAPTVRNCITKDQLHLPQVCPASAPDI